MVGGDGGKCSDLGHIIKVQSIWFADRFAMREKDVKPDFQSLASVIQRMKFSST